MSLDKSNEKDVKFYYNRKSKYFEDKKDMFTTIARITIHEFMKYLQLAYDSETTVESELFDLYWSYNIDGLRVTQTQLFSELVEVDLDTLYCIFNENNYLRRIKINNNFNVFSYCDYFLSTSTETNSLSTSIATLKPNNLDCETGTNLKVDEERYKTNEISSNNQLKGSMTAKDQKVQNETMSEEVDILNNYQPNLIDDCTNLGKKDFSVNKISSITGENVLCNNCMLSNQMIVLRVTDSVKCQTKTFTCLEELLVSKMGYFAKKNLFCTEVDIQCDLNIFEWVIDWVIQNGSLNKFENQTYYKLHLPREPPLDSQNAIRFLIIVSFFEIEELINMCLWYCKSNMNTIIKCTRNFSCLSDGIQNRLCDVFSNVEVESLNDEKDKIQSYLYCKLILSLSLPEPEPWKGHFGSLASIFKCIQCKRLVMNEISGMIPCLQTKMQLNLKGKVTDPHVRDPEWNLTEYIASLKKELKYWRNVYWRLWAECHFIYCLFCRSFYSVYHYNQCFYHPEEPDFSEQNQLAKLVSTYPCCGTKAYKYECCACLVKGCKTKNHQPLLYNNRASTDTWKLFQLYQKHIFSSDFSDNIGSRKLTQSQLRNNFKSPDISSKQLINKIHWKLPHLVKERPKGLLNKGLRKSKYQGLITIISKWTPKGTHFCKFGSIMDCYSNEEFDFNETNNLNDTQVTLVMLAENTTEINDENSIEDLSKLSNIMECCSDVNCYVNNLEDFKSNISENYTKKQRYSRIQKKLNMSTRINKDNQRDAEEHMFLSINLMLRHESNQNDKKMSGSCSSADSVIDSSSLSSLDSNDKVNYSRKISYWNSHAHLPGTFVQIEQKWKTSPKNCLNLLFSRSFNKFSNTPF